ncbi:hypothetical protein BEN47_06070 [Hymenobacter lapidarius]|uniref:Terminase n=1 Tax=Hymenobacter lapidarius TaxID=1908237 RepID=A0A1G1SQC1_9BACT|nr:terminase small subunit [Hymenobacter lapidarius]OGX80820.1 hypothetical protein BEN47_06070 [Hymenobacter lapidarius]
MMPQDLPEEEAEAPKFTARQQRFIAAFCVSGNCTKAAKEAGYSEEYAYSIGSRLSKNVEIRAAIDERLAAYSISAALATKLNSEIAQSCVNEFLKIENVEESTKIQQPLQDYIEEILVEIAFEEEYAKRANLQEEELDEHKFKQRKRRRAIIRLQLQLENDSLATHTIAGPPVLVKRARLDLVKLAEAREGGRIKSLSFGEFGPKVELYAADAAIDRAARMHGLYEKDNRQAAGTEVEIVIGGSPKETA